MKAFKSMEKIVLSVLEESPFARADDCFLMYLVCKKVKPEINKIPFAYVMNNHHSLGLPNWETVTRCRRKIQNKRPDLVIEKTARKRRKATEKYKEYARN